MQSDSDEARQSGSQAKKQTGSQAVKQPSSQHSAGGQSDRQAVRWQEVRQ
jgi:hypothetical protein